MKKHSNHIKMLDDTFFKKISDSSGLNVELPDLPTGYRVSFLRLSERTLYHFSDNTGIVLSKEDFQVGYKNPKDLNSNPDNIDVFFVNDHLNEMVDSNEWEIDEIMNEIEKTLIFSDQIKQFLR